MFKDTVYEQVILTVKINKLYDFINNNENTLDPDYTEFVYAEIKELERLREFYLNKVAQGMY